MSSPAVQVGSTLPQPASLFLRYRTSISPSSLHNSSCSQCQRTQEAADVIDTTSVFCRSETHSVSAPKSIGRSDGYLRRLRIYGPSVGDHSQCSSPAEQRWNKSSMIQTKTLLMCREENNSQTFWDVSHIFLIFPISTIRIEEKIKTNFHFWQG